MYQVNFALWRMERQLTRYRFWRNVGLCQGGIFILALIAMQMQSHSVQISQQRSLAALSHQQTVLNQQHQQVQQGMAQKQHIEQRVKIYRQMQQSAGHYATLLQLFSQQIPDNCWLINWMPQGDKLVFEAVSQDYVAIHDFLARLSQQPLLADVRLQKIAQRDDGHFQFMVQANWQGEEINDE